jgi:hypothetical protein
VFSFDIHFGVVRNTPQFASRALGTARNMNTVAKLAELAREME